VKLEYEANGNRENCFQQILKKAKSKKTQNQKHIHQQIKLTGKIIRKKSKDTHKKHNVGVTIFNWPNCSVWVIVIFYPLLI